MQTPFETLINEAINDIKPILLGYHDRYSGAFDKMDLAHIMDAEDADYQAFMLHVHVLDECEQFVYQFQPNNLENPESRVVLVTHTCELFTLPVRLMVMSVLFPEETARLTG